MVRIINFFNFFIFWPSVSDVCRKESENLAKEMKIVRNRLERIHQLDKQRKKNFKEQLEVLENKRKNQELLRKKKSFKKINPQDLFSQKKMKILNKLETKLD